MRGRSISVTLGRVASLSLLLLVAGCGPETTLRAQRYSIERMLWSAERAETEGRLVAAHPDSATLLALRERYLGIAGRIRVPEVPSSDPEAVALRREVTRLLATTEIHGARLAMQARRHDLAIDAARRVAAQAGGDTLVARRADFFLVAAYRETGRFDEAASLMQEMLRRYPPIPPERSGEEDAILSIPEGIIRLRKDAGDEAGARAGLDEAVSYYRSLLERPRAPMLQAQIQARLIRAELEIGDWTSALRHLETLKKLVEATPELEGLKPEVLYSEAKLEAIRTGKTNPAPAIAKLDRFAREYPKSPNAGRAMLEAGVLLEGSGKKREALERYRAVAAAYPEDQEVAPAAIFRRAMLEEQFENWDISKNLLESLPVRYPETRAALEAPLAIVHRYVRARDMDAARLAVERAVGTFQELATRDTTSSYVPLYLWSVYRCQVTLGDWKAAVATVEGLTGRYVGHPVAAQALLEGARLAHQHKDDDTARRFLARFLAHYPRSPAVESVRRELAELGKGQKS